MNFILELVNDTAHAIHLDKIEVLPPEVTGKEIETIKLYLCEPPKAAAAGAAIPEPLPALRELPEPQPDLVKT